METDPVWMRLGQVFESVFREPVALARETTAADVDGWDSVRNIELLVAVEREFGLRFTTAELSGFENVGELVDALAKRAALA